MSMPLIPPFAVTAAYQNSQYATGTYTQGGSQVFSHLVTPPVSGVAAEDASDTAAEAVGWVAATEEPSANEAQLVTLEGATSGTFILTFGGVRSAPIPFDSANTAVQTALAAMTSIGTGNVAVTGNAGGPWTVTFQGALVSTDVDLMGIDTSGLNVPTVTVATTVPGVAPVNEVQIVTVTAADGGTYALTFDGQKTNPEIAFDAAASAVQTALESLSNIDSGDVAVEGDAGGPYTVTFQGTLAATDVAEMTADITNLTGEGAAVTVDTSVPGFVGTSEVQTVTVANAESGTFTLTFVDETDPIDFDASTAELTTALEGLDAITSGDVVVTGTPGDYTVTFAANFATVDVFEMTADASGLVGADASGTVAETVKGSGWVNEALLDASRQRDGMRDFYDTASGNHF